MAKKIIRFIIALTLGLFIGFILSIFVQLLISDMLYRDCPTYDFLCETSSPWGIATEASGFIGLLLTGLLIYIFYKISGKFIKS